MGMITILIPKKAGNCCLAIFPAVHACELAHQVYLHFNMARILWGFHIVVGIYNIYSPFKPHLCNETEGITAGRRPINHPQKTENESPAHVTLSPLP